MRSTRSRRSSTSRPGRTAAKVVLGVLLAVGVLGVAVTGAAVWQRYGATPPAERADPELAALGIACEAQLKGGGAPGPVAAGRGARTAAAPARPAGTPSDARVIDREKTDILADAEGDRKAEQAEENGDDTAYSRHTADRHWMRDYASSARESAAARDDCARYFREVRQHGRGVAGASAAAPHP